MNLKSERGSAMLESLPMVVLLVMFTAGILLAAYLLFTRAWIQYQSEQALYCAVEGKPSVFCRTQLDAKLKDTLPWGESHTQIQSWSGNWSVEVQWKFRSYNLRLAKHLSPKQILKAKALRW